MLENYLPSVLKEWSVLLCTRFWDIKHMKCLYILEYWHNIPLQTSSVTFDLFKHNHNSINSSIYKLKYL